MKQTLETRIRELAANYAVLLQQKIDRRLQEMETDDHSHFLIYRVLGVSDEEGRLIDVYQNKGRFLYNTAGRFLEEVAKLCFLSRYPDSGSLKIPNTRGQRPKTFEIVCGRTNRR
ncbi:MAG TPA: ApaLI family restriction endonuclease [Chloroflexi bacterium]|nr:ApaLI family restriction endonuclease [Chloroflexota bacterium]